MTGHDLGITATGPRSFRLDARVLGSGTTLRFALLLLLCTAGGAGLSSQVAADLAEGTIDNRLGCAVAGGVNPAVGLTAGSVSGLRNYAAVQACWARYVPDTAWVPLVVVPLLMAAAAGVYWLLPQWKGRRSRLVPLELVDLDGRLRQELAALVARAEVGIHLEFSVDPAASTVGAVVFGTGRRPAVCLYGGLLAVFSADPDRFRAVVLHEFAHVRNGDIAVTYATVALWRVFAGVVLLPAAAEAAYFLITDRFPATWHVPAVYAYYLAGEALIALMVYLTRADLLRTRELYADLTAARLWTCPLDMADNRTAKVLPRGRWARALAAVGGLWRTHPSWRARRRALAAPEALFGLGALPLFATGLTVDLAVSQLASNWPGGPGAAGTAWPLLTAGLVTAIGGAAVWRAVACALIESRAVPSGWAAGFWLGTGLAAGTLTDSNAASNGVPPYPEAVAILVAVVMLLSAWTAQYAEASIRLHRGRSLRTAMLTGLIPTWLVLALVLSWWTQLDLVNGWLYSRGLLTEMGVPAAHPPLLMQIDAVLAALPGDDVSFAGLWWALPLLWLLPLALWAARRPAAVPGWLARAKPGSAPLAADLPGLRRTVRTGLLGGLACCAGLLASAAAVGTVRSLNDTAKVAAEFDWTVLVITGAMTATAAVVAAAPGAYPLIRALIASGLVAMTGILAAYLQESADGCLGPANTLFTHSCAIRPGFPLPRLELALGYVFGPAFLICMAAAALAHAASTRLRQHRRHTAPVAKPTGTGRPHLRHTAIAVMITAAVGLTGADTIRAEAATQAPASDSQVADVFSQPPVPSPLTERVQVDAWAYYGFSDMYKDLDPASSALVNAFDALNRATSAQFPAAWKSVHPACAKVYPLAASAAAYFPVPVGSGQSIWATAVAALGDAAGACRTLERTKNPERFNAVFDDLTNAYDAIDALIDWMGPASSTPGTTPTATTLGRSEPFTTQGITLWLTAANYTAYPAGAGYPPGDRIATITVRSCLNAIPSRTAVNARPGWSSWTLAFADGTIATPARGWSLHDLGTPLYPDDSLQLSAAGDCVGGLIPFDIPAAEKNDPVKVVYTPAQALAKTITWLIPHTPSHDSIMLGTSQPLNSADTKDRLTVTGYFVRPAGVNGEHLPPGDRIATITVQACMVGISATSAAAWAPWTLILADGTTASPVRSWTPRDFNAPLYPSASPGTASRSTCRTGLIPFDIPAVDHADPVEITYMPPSNYLDWQLMPPLP